MCLTNISQNWIFIRSHELGPGEAIDHSIGSLLRWNGRNGFILHSIATVSSQFQSLQVNLQLPVSQVVSKSEETQAIHDSVDFQWHRKRQGNARINIQNDKLGK